ncbi:MAG TPA: hypothetical protein VMU30_07145 [Bacteroidota bacterium]|nr:hypothetical protein [Bacteroidota bacterium]
MKTVTKILLLTVLLGAVMVAQFKDQQGGSSSVSQSLIKQEDSGLLFGWFNLSKLTMHQSYSMSYTTNGSQGYSLGVYTNNLAYQLSDPLVLHLGVNLVASPFNTMGGNFSKDVSGLYLSNVDLTYHPTPSTYLQLSYRQLPAMYWLNNFDSGIGYWPNLGIVGEEESH